jgi:hypothetical protein
MSSDTLTVSSRAFFERTKGKFTMSVVAIAGSIFLLGLCSMAGGLSAANQQYHDRSGTDDHSKNASENLAIGYAFGSLFFIIACLLLCCAGVYISPLACGSPKEGKMINSPQEIDSGYSSYTENGSAPSEGNLNV